jgi:hypothetical protein
MNNFFARPRKEESAGFGIYKPAHTNINDALIKATNSVEQGHPVNAMTGLWHSLFGMANIPWSECVQIASDFSNIDTSSIQSK